MIKIVNDRQSGFTIIELLIATTIFSFILLIATAGIIKIGQLYYKGVTESKTQEVVRSISDELSRSIQFANQAKRAGSASNPNIYCLGDTRYTININQKYDSKTDLAGVPIKTTGLIAERIGVGVDCTSASSLQTRQLLGNQMRLLKLEVTPLGTNDDAWNVKAKIAYGDDDLLTHYDNAGVLLPAPDIAGANCKSGISGSSFCATAQLDTVIKKRLN